MKRKIFYEYPTGSTPLIGLLPTPPPLPWYKKLWYRLTFKLRQKEDDYFDEMYDQ